jgi:hypothetical protein
MTEPRRHGAQARAFRRRFAAAAAVLLLLLAPWGMAAAQEHDRDHDEDRDTKSRHEMRDLQHIPLVRRGGTREDIRRLVIIQVRFISISETRLGIDIDNLDRVNVSDVPLLSSLFDKPLRAEDLNDDNRVGAVYSTGNGGLAAFVSNDVDVGDSAPSVVNGKYRYTPTGSPQEAGAAQVNLGDLGKLPSVRQAVAGQAPEGATIVLRGLTATSVPEVGGEVPALSDVPVLQELFRGTVHDYDDDLIFFIRPSIIAGDEAE